MKQSAEKFSVFVPKIIKQAEIERTQNSRLDGLLDTLTLSGKFDLQYSYISYIASSDKLYNYPKSSMVWIN